MKHFFYFSLIFCLFLACNSDEKACKRNSDCPGSERCMNGACTIECKNKKDCSAGKACLKGSCVKVKASCDYDKDCLQSPDCSDGVCECMGGFCELKNTTSLKPSGTDGSSTGSSAGGNYGLPCGLNSECKSGLCAKSLSLNSSFCSKVCLSNSDCPAPDLCEDHPAGGKACIKKSGGNTGTGGTGSTGTSGGGTIGSSCAQVGNSCQKGSCYKLDAGNNICTVTCQNDSQCPNNYVCAGVRDAQNQVIAACVPKTGGGTKPFGSGCNAGSDCRSVLCLGIGGASGYCTMRCFGQTCPTGYSCIPIADKASPTGKTRICILNTKGASRACSSNTQCLDIGGLCDDSIPMCIGYCSSNSDCPAQYPLCHPATQRCSQCTNDLHCPANAVVGCFLAGKAIGICL